MFTMTSITNNNGNGGNYYAGVLEDAFEYEVEGYPIQSLPVLTLYFPEIG